MARPAHDAVDVIDTRFGAWLYAVPELRGVRAVLAAQELNELFAANTAEHKIGFFQAGDRSAEKMVVGRRPIALAWDARRGVLWVANAGRPARLDECSLSLVDFVTQTRVLATVALPGRPRVLCYDDVDDILYAGIDDPPRMVTIAGGAPTEFAAVQALPAGSVQSLLHDAQANRLLALCADGALLSVDMGTGQVGECARLAGASGDAALDAPARRLYVANGAAGTLTVLDAVTFQLVATTPTEAGADHLFLDGPAKMLYLFCPGSSRALVFRLD